MPVLVYDLQIDEWNEAEAGRHHVTAREMRQVLDNDPVFLPNKKRHKATLVMIGPTYGGRLLTIPLAATDVAGVWRPATAWEAEPEERGKYRAAGGGRQ